MKIFDLSYTIEFDGSVCLKPSDPLISEYICTWKKFETIPNNDDISLFINEMKPLLFNDFKSMESIGDDIKDLFIIG